MSDEDFDDLDAILDEAKPAFETVHIYLDGERRAEWNALVLAAKQGIDQAETDGRLGARSPAAQALKSIEKMKAELQGKVISIRVEQMPGTRWAALKAKHQPRKNDVRDQQQGYNCEAVAKESLLTYGKRVKGDKVAPITAAQWQKIWDKAGGGDWDTLIWAVIGVNQLAGQMFVSQLVKGSPATSNSAGK